MALDPIQFSSTGSVGRAMEDEPGLGSALAGAGLGAGMGAIAGAGLPGAIVGGTIGFFGGLGWLDFLGRPARTLLGTGDVSQAWESVWDKSKASTEDDLLRQYMGWEPMDQGEGFDMGDVADFVFRVGVGAATDPLTYINPAALTRKAAMTRTLGYKTVGKYQKALGELDADIKLGKIGEAEGKQMKGLLANRIAREHNLEAAEKELQAGLDVGDMTRVNEPYRFEFGPKWEFTGPYTEEGYAAKILKQTPDEMNAALKARGIETLEERAAALKASGKEPPVLQAPVTESEQTAAILMNSLGIKMELPESHDLLHQLSNFGLGKTFAERVALGQQWAVGFGRPWGEDKAHGLALKPLVDFLSAKGEIVESAARATPLGRWVINSTSDLRQYLFNPVRRDALEQITNRNVNLQHRFMNELEPDILEWHNTLGEVKLTDDEFAAYITLVGYNNKDSQVAMETLLKSANDTLAQGGVDRAAKITQLAAQFNKIEAKALRLQQEAGVPIVGLKDDLRDSVKFLRDERGKREQARLVEEGLEASALRRRNEIVKNIDAVAGHQDEVLDRIRGTATYADDLSKYERNKIAHVARKTKLGLYEDELERKVVGKAVSRDARAWMDETGGSVEAYYTGPDSPFATYTKEDLDQLAGLTGTRKKGAGGQPSATRPAEAGAGIPPASPAPVTFDDVRIKLIDNLKPESRAAVRAELDAAGVNLDMLNEVVGGPGLAKQVDSAEYTENFARAQAAVDGMVADANNPLAKYIERMRSADGAQLPQAAKPQPKLTTLEKKYNTRMPWNMTREEWAENVAKHSWLNKKTGEPLDAAATSAEHIRSIARAIVEENQVVPMRVLDSYDGYPIYMNGNQVDMASLKAQNVQNAAKYSTGVVLPAEDWKQWNKLERDILAKTQSRAEKEASLKLLDATIKQTEDILARTPEHMHSIFTQEALESSIQRSPGQKMAVGRVGSAMRKFIQNGHALTPADVNDLIKEDRTAGQLLALGGKRPEGFVPLGDLFHAMSSEISDDAAKGWAQKILRKGASEAEIAAKASELKRVPQAERIKMVSGAYAKLFDERPEVALAATLDQAAQSITNSKMIDDVRNLFARKQVAQDVEGLNAVKERNAQRKAQIEDLKANKGTGQHRKDANKEIRRLEKEMERERKLVVSTSDSTQKWVAAENLDPHLKGYEMKEEVYNRLIQYRQMMNKPETYSAVYKALAWHTKWFKIGALGWPGTWFRDAIGNSLQRAQHGGYHARSLSWEEQSKMAQVVWSNGKADKLQGIAFEFPGVGGVGPSRKVTGKEMFKHMLAGGLWDGDMASAEVLNAMRHKKNVADKFFNKWFKPRTFVQTLDKTQMFHSRLMAGDDFAEAAAKVNGALFDYRNVSPFVQTMRQTGIIPFGTWLSKNIPAQIEMFAKHPGQFAGLLHVKAAVERGVPGVSDKDLPDYVKNKFNIVLGKRDGQVVFFTADNVIPMADLPALGTKSVGQWLSDALGPIPKGLFEQMANHELYNWKKIQAYDGQLSPLGGQDLALMPAKTAHGLKVMIGRPLTVVEEGAEWITQSSLPPTKQKGFFGRPALVNALTGVGVRTADAKDALRRNIEAQKAEVSAARRDADYYRKRGQMNAAKAAQERAYQLEQQMRR